MASFLTWSGGTGLPASLQGGGSVVGVCDSLPQGRCWSPHTLHAPCEGHWLWGRWRGRPNGVNTQHHPVTLQWGGHHQPCSQGLASPSACELNTRVC